MSTPRQLTSRLGLSRERILDAALGLLDARGLDALSMRQLGDHLGIGTMTLYGYFGSKDELLDAVVDHGISRMEIVDPGGTWKQRLRALMVQTYEQLLEHPAIVELRFKRPLLSPGALEITELGMRILHDAGFSTHDAARIYRTLFVFTFGFAAFGPRDQAEVQARTLEALRGLPEDRFPMLREAAVEAADSMADAGLFELGLDRLLDGLRR